MLKKILIIDDDKCVVEMIKAALMKENYEVLTAGDGKEGLEMVKKDHPDLILVDIVMPQMNGYEFLRALKALKIIEGEEMILVFVITAKEQMEELFKFEGVKEYFIKPVDTSELIKKIKAYIQHNG